MVGSVVVSLPSFVCVCVPPLPPVAAEIRERPKSAGTGGGGGGSSVDDGLLELDDDDALSDLIDSDADVRDAAVFLFHTFQYFCQSLWSSPRLSHHLLPFLKLPSLNFSKNISWTLMPRQNERPDTTPPPPPPPPIMRF